MRDQSGCSEPIAASTEHDGGEPNTVRHQLRPLATVALVLRSYAHERMLAFGGLCRYAIQGGLLALHAGGSVTLAQRPADEGVELSVVVEECLPRLAARFRAPNWTGALYAKGQRPLHAAVGRRYFELLASRAGV
jgi:hypothetical protein